MSNSTLKKARSAKNDEFYTQLTDIEKELRHYRSKFENKVIYSNCDDPRFSNFVRYFVLNFSFFKMKKFIATYYNKDGHGGKLVVTNDNIDKFLIDGDYQQTAINDNIEQLTGDGDFRSNECVEILKSADIVVTNPPFSLFREFVGLILDKKMLGSSKRLITIGNSNAITYKEIFPLLKANRLWIGYYSVKSFEIPKSTANDKSEYVNGKYYTKMGNICWFTNVDIDKRHQKIDLYCNYYDNENNYPKYDNYNAINVNKVSEIPVDYDGVMGVPISFMMKYDPEQFEIIGLGNNKDNLPNKTYINPIKHLPNGNNVGGQAINSVLVIPFNNINGVYYSAEQLSFNLIAPYSRILIKKVVI